MIPPIGDQLSATVRRYVVRNVTLDDLVARDSLSAQAAAFLHVLMQLRSRVTVSGEPGAGKTTLLAALLAAAPANQCVRACEEIREGKLHEEFVHVTNIVTQLPPLFQRFYGDESKRTCKACGARFSDPK